MKSKTIAMPQQDQRTVKQLDISHRSYGVIQSNSVLA